MLDYLWAGLPMVATEGDGFAELIHEHGLGAVVGSENAPALAAAIERAVYDEEFNRSARAAVAGLRADFEWSTVLRPLVDFCADPRPAADPRSSCSRIVRRPSCRDTRPSGSPAERSGCGAKAVLP